MRKYVVYVEISNESKIWNYETNADGVPGSRIVRRSNMYGVEYPDSGLRKVV